MTDKEVRIAAAYQAYKDATETAAIATGVWCIAEQEHRVAQWAYERALEDCRLANQAYKNEL